MNKSQTNRLLGYPVDSRLLIINADDFGMCHSVNEAVFRAFQNGVLQSTTLMVPCPWALHAMHFLADHPEISLGVHLTAISDWVDYRWGPLTPRDKVPSLINHEGYFYDFDHMPEFLAHVNLEELRLEFRALAEATEFITLMTFDLLESVREFAGEDYEQAVVPQKTRAALSHFDQRSQHYEIREARKGTE